MNKRLMVARKDESAEVTEAIEELISEFGVRATVAACLNSSAGSHFDKLGGNATLAVVQALIREIVFDENPQLAAEIIALGAGVLLENNRPMTSVAEKLGVTKAAVSKRVIDYCDANGLPPSIYMRSVANRETYALTNRPRGG
jgi:hypothetical protein